ncbi:DUF4177 domain-containing protein [Blautia wexlerae]|uniref:DUF4177 domain-containing protein n=1 Tax=Blautia wexlerae TaxID=418240 RepID=A0ABX2GKK7_9FIRM|nr:DUF4177 domain-containing protein [Blautia wexlerae]NSF72859.1 DUF4177 domain-containing protein [Blautia wexlerae]
MKTCPKCKELVGDNVESCFNCNYNFILKRVPSYEETIELKENVAATKKKREEEREELIKSAPHYEYTVARVLDNRNGSTNQEKLQSVLTEYAMEGWKLHSVITNEIGKNISAVSIGGITGGTNATVDEIILIFERMVSKGNLKI